MVEGSQLLEFMQRALLGTLCEWKHNRVWNSSDVFGTHTNAQVCQGAAVSPPLARREKRWRAPSKGIASTVSIGIALTMEGGKTRDASYPACCQRGTETLPTMYSVEAKSDSSAPGLGLRFRQRVEGLLEKQEEKLRKLSIEYDEELYPQHAGMPSDRAQCALARGKVEVVEELHEKGLLTVPAAQELPHIAHAGACPDLTLEVIKAGLVKGPIFSRPCDILNPFALEREIPLKESLEAHAIRLAKKKGVRVATVLPKDSELLGKLEEAGDAAYQVGSAPCALAHPVVDMSQETYSQRLERKLVRIVGIPDFRWYIGLFRPHRLESWSVPCATFDCYLRCPTGTCCDNSSTHLHLYLSRRCFDPSPDFDFARSTNPFGLGCINRMQSVSVMLNLAPVL
ncbi:hypothetical protein Tco_1032657 [Tanacetum coccineum]|uniref:Uncharacterized protein n=1 Tax=Tanacetum coccineum TaxID=301880 RepID=A0ABQ5GCX2_9ASTR